MGNFTFLHIGRGLFFLAALLLVILFSKIFLKRKHSAPRFPLHFFNEIGVNFNNLLLFKILKYLFLTSFVIFTFLGISEFSKKIVIVKPKTKGIDIAIAFDISTSMSAKDFKPDRLTVSKEVLKKFVNMRKNDRIALLTFAADTYVISPLTLDHNTLINLISSIQLIPFDLDGTAIGMAIVNGINLLRHSKAKSKVLLLITDGSNNRGEISPLTAADFARDYNIKIYTIGIGSGKKADVLGLNMFNEPVYVKRIVQFDEKILKKIAKKTGGRYFRATDGKALYEIAKKIDKMERTPFERNSEIKIKNLDNFFFLFSLISILGYISILTFVEKNF